MGSEAGRSGRSRRTDSRLRTRGAAGAKPVRDRRRANSGAAGNGRERLATPPTPTPTPTPTLEVNERGLSGSNLFYRRSSTVPSAVAAISVRQEFTVVTLAAETVVKPLGSLAWLYTPSNGGGFITEVGGHRVRLNVLAGNRSTRVLATGDALAIYSTEESVLPQLIVMATAEGSGEPHYLEVDEFGNLHLAPEPQSSTLVVDFDTGAALDLTGATAVGPLAAVVYTQTFCEFLPACAASLHTDTGGLRAPSSGSVTCTGQDEQTIVLVTDGFELRIRRQLNPIGGVPPGPVVCLLEGSIEAGDQLTFQGGQYYIEAFDSSGEPLDVAVDKMGKLYVGKFRPVIGCPCRRSVTLDGPS